MKKAYLIMAHKNPNQLNRLVDRLDDGSSHFFIHIDIKAKLESFGNLKKWEDKISYLDRVHARWGRYGIVLPLLAGLEAAMIHETEFDRMIVLSGQDYPIKSNASINRTLANATHQVFINYTLLPDFKQWPGKDRGGLYRLDKYYFGDKWHERFRSKTLNFLANYNSLFGRKMPLDMKGFAGSAWMILDKYVTKYILEFHTQNPEYFKFHKDTFVADEVYIQMIIGNTDDIEVKARLKNANHHFMIWENPQSAHPKVFETSDLEAIKNAPQLFARKFDENLDAQIMDLIDQHILFK